MTGSTSSPEERENMKLREDAKWGVVVPTSIGVRITPENRQPVHTSQNFFMQVTSAETNVASVVSYLGEPTKVLTAFVEGSPISALIKSNLLARHMSGVIAALSPKTSNFCVELAKAAKKHGTVIAMDLNYRASFWKGREEELTQAFHDIAEVCDILYGNEEDFQLCLGIEGPEAGGKSIDEKIEDFKAMIGRVEAAYPEAKYIGTSLREVVSANHHKWGMVLWGEGEFVVCPLRDIDVIDRIGGGDGSVGGVLWGILKGWSVEQCAQFGWATGALAATSILDYGAPADEEQVWAIWKGNARVKR